MYPTTLSLLLDVTSVTTNLVTEANIVQVLALKIVGGLLGFAGVLWGVYVWKTKRNEDAVAAEKLALATKFDEAAKKAKDYTAQVEQAAKEERTDIRSILATVGTTLNVMHGCVMDIQRDIDKKYTESMHRHDTAHQALVMMENVPGRLTNLESKYETINTKLDSQNETIRELKETVKSDAKERREENNKFMDRIIALIQNDK